MRGRSAAVDRADEAQRACDRLEALLTCPTEPTAQRAWIGRGAPRPAEEPWVWTSHVALRHRRHPADRERLVVHYQPHARRLAQRFYRHGEPIDDLEQVAYEALLLALERFDPARGLPFLGFANPTIIGSLKRHYRDAGWALRVPRRVHDLSQPLRQAHDQLAQDLGRPPTPSELADLLGVPTEDVLAAQDAERVRATASLDSPEPDGSGTLQDRIGSLDRELNRVEELATVQSALQHLSDDSRDLLALYFEDGLTQKEIGRRIGVSQMQVSRLLDRALAQIRSHLPSS
jgi:RNA polymerase sigma-B factor